MPLPTTPEGWRNYYRKDRSGTCGDVFETMDDVAEFGAMLDAHDVIGHRLANAADYERFDELVAQAMKRWYLTARPAR